MINQKYEGPIKFTAPAEGVEGGKGYLIGSLFVIAIVSVAEGEIFDGIVANHCALLPKEAAIAFAEGDKLYWDDTAKKLTSVTLNNYLVGICASAAIAADEEVACYLLGHITKAEAA